MSPWLTGARLRQQYPGMDSPTIVSHDYRPEYALETVTMWRRAFQRAMGLAEHDPHDALADQLAYFGTIRPGTVRIAIDAASRAIVGMMVLDGSDPPAPVRPRRLPGHGHRLDLFG